MTEQTDSEENGDENQQQIESRAVRRPNAWTLKPSPWQVTNMQIEVLKPELKSLKYRYRIPLTPLIFSFQFHVIIC